MFPPYTLSVHRQTSQHTLSGGNSITLLSFLMSISGYRLGRLAWLPWAAQLMAFLSMFFLTYPLVNHTQAHLNNVKICGNDNELFCEDMESTPVGSCAGRREAMTDHILGLESKISSLFSLHSPTIDHKKDFGYFVWPHIIKLLFKGNILVWFMLLMRFFRIKGFALIC